MRALSVWQGSEEGRTWRRGLEQVIRAQRNEKGIHGGESDSAGCHHQRRGRRASLHGGWQNPALLEPQENREDIHVEAGGSEGPVQGIGT